MSKTGKVTAESESIDFLESIKYINEYAALWKWTHELWELWCCLLCFLILINFYRENHEESKYQSILSFYFQKFASGARPSFICSQWFIPSLYTCIDFSRNEWENTFFIMSKTSLDVFIAHHILCVLSWLLFSCQINGNQLSNDLV